MRLPSAALAVCLSACGAAPRVVVDPPAEHLGVLAREPMVVQAPDGSLFASGYGPPTPSLWKSTDGGAAWARLELGTPRDGAVGNSDLDLAVAPDGTVYFATMTFDRKAGEGRRIDIGASRDGGARWQWRKLSATRFDDRPWVEVAPDGTAHVIWNDGAGVCHAVSRDRGASWLEQPRIHPQGGSSHLAIGPAGELAVRITPLSASGNRFDAGVDLVAVSRDGGATWQKHPAPGERHWQFPLAETDPLPRWVEPLAWDARGTLFSLWATPDALWLARSADHGLTWATWRLAAGGPARFFPYLVARGAGELAASWFTLDAQERLRAHVGLISVDEAGAARLAEAAPFEPDTWSLAAEGPPRPDAGGEYLALLFLADGGLAVATPVQNARAQRLGFALRRVRSP